MTGPSRYRQADTTAGCRRSRRIIETDGCIFAGGRQI
jgi:hypothetical protein